MMAAYKDAAPADTIRRARQILSDLGIEVKEEVFSRPGVACSCRITIANPRLAPLNIGTNGKGLTEEYALASGYAEMLERLQNKMLLNEGTRYAGRLEGVEPLPYRYFPDEEPLIVSEAEFHAVARDLFPKSVAGINPETVRTPLSIIFYAAPYANVTRGVMYRLPVAYARLAGSTGMCAGNTPAEAILQGLCEIYERHQLLRLFAVPIAPPRFSREDFASTESLSRIEALEAQGYACEILDMTEKGTYPVVGVIITDPQGRKMLRLGSDLDADIALQRCLTETFQGDSAVADSLFRDYEKEERKFNPAYQFYLCLHNGSGYYPDVVMKGEPTEPSTPWPFKRSGDSAADLRAEIDRLKRYGLDVLVRDNSFLGFCAYHVVVPGLSELASHPTRPFLDYLRGLKCFEDNATDDYRGTIFHKGPFLRENSDGIWPLYNVRELVREDEIAYITDFVWSNQDQGSDMHLTPWDISSGNTVNRNILLFLINAKFANESDDKIMEIGSAAFNLNIGASAAMGRFVIEREAAGFTDNEYFKCINDEYKGRAMQGKGFLESLYPYRTDDLAEQVRKDLEGDVMRNFHFPTCFHCERCPVADGCRLRDIFDIVRRLQQREIEAKIDQSELFKLYPHQ